MQSVELTLIKIIGDHFYENTGKLRKVEFNGRNFFDRYERIDSQLTMSIQKEHFEGKRVIAHDLINDKEKIHRKPMAQLPDFIFRKAKIRRQLL